MCEMVRDKKLKEVKELTFLSEGAQAPVLMLELKISLHFEYLALDLSD